MTIEAELNRVMAEVDIFTADDVTRDGAITPDAGHGVNAKNNGIGALFRAARQRGWIEPTGEVVQSKAPHRKGGAIRVWRVTPAGRRHGQSA